MSRFPWKCCAVAWAVTILFSSGCISPITLDQGPTRSPQLAKAACATLLDFRSWGIVPGATSREDGNRLVVDNLSDVIQGERAFEYPYMAVDRFNLNEDRSIESPDRMIALYSQNGVLTQIDVYWYGSHDSSLGALRECLGEPAFYDAAVVVDTQLRLDFSVWYPDLGMKATSITYLDSEDFPELSDNSQVGMLTWVGPGTPEFIQKSINSILPPEVDTSEQLEATMSRLHPWDGDWSKLHIERP